MAILFTIVHVFVCLFLVVVVLLQSGKAADLSGAFGGMGSQTAFGPRGSATVLSKATTLAAVLFMVTSMSLAVIATRSSGAGSTVLEREAGKLSKPAPQKQVPGSAPAQAPGPQPSMTVSTEDGSVSKTVPITLPPKPPAQGQQQQKQPPAPPQQKQ